MLRKRVRGNVGAAREAAAGQAAAVWSKMQQTLDYFFFCVILTGPWFYCSCNHGNGRVVLVPWWQRGMLGSRLTLGKRSLNVTFVRQLAQPFRHFICNKLLFINTNYKTNYITNIGGAPCQHCWLQHQTQCQTLSFVITIF